MLFAILFSLVGCGETPTVTTKDPLSYNLPYPYIDPTDYCKITLDFDRLSVVLDKELQITDADVDEYIHKLQDEFIPDEIVKTAITDRPIKEGDVIYFYYYATVDGKTFPDSSNIGDETPYRLYVGSETMLRDVGVEDFDKHLLGVVPGDTYSDVKTTGTVKEGDVVYITGSVIYRDGDIANPEAIEVPLRVDLSKVPEKFGQGFDAAVIGAEIGETLNFSLTQDFDGDGQDETKNYYLFIERAGKEQTLSFTVNFPLLYVENPPLAGKTAEFEVIVTHIEERTYPELTRSFILEYCKYYPTTADPVGEYRAFLRKNIEAQYQTLQNQVVEGSILDILCENMTDVIYPEGTLVYCYEYYLAEIQLLMEEQEKLYTTGGCPFTTFEEFTLLYYGLTDLTTDDVDEWIMEKCERTVKENLAVFYVGRALGFTVEESEVRRYAAALANQMNQEQSAVKYTEDIILRDLGRDYIECNVMYAKVMNYLLTRTTVTFE